MQAFVTSTGIRLDLDGWETQQKGVWKYTLPCILRACATFPACNWHGGYALWFLTVQLNGTLEMMQNDVKTSEFEYRSTEIDLFLMMLFVNNFLEKNFVFWEIHLHLMLSGQQMNLE